MRAVILTSPLPHRNHEISRKYDCYMGSQGFKGPAVAFTDQLKITFAGLEKDLYLPSFSINTDDLLCRESRICADKDNPFLLVLLFAHTYNLYRDLPVFADHYIYRKQIFAAAAALLADAKYFINGEPFSIVLIVYTGTLPDHGNGIQPEVFDVNELRRAGEPRIKQDVVCMVTSGSGSPRELDHDLYFAALSIPSL